jgi:hypothetical protein
MQIVGTASAPHEFSATFGVDWTTLLQPDSRLGVSRIWALVFAGAAILGAIVMWGFTVDDALISIRYARHLAAGLGYRFDAGGPSTDGVTPLPWPFLLAPLAHGDALDVLVRVKVLGVALHAVSAALLARVEAPAKARIASVALLVACLPFAAYGASGMETPVATLLCTVAVVFHDRGWAALVAGLAATIRPELAPWAVTIACGFALARRASPRDVVVAFALGAAPFATCAVIRRVAFGRFAPLALLAKPSDVSHGLVYAGAALLACGLPLLLVTTTLRRIPAPAKVVAIAFGVHALAVIAAGGDSMAFARLFVPLVPSLLFVHLHSANIACGPVFWLRSACAFGLASWMFVGPGVGGRHVMRDRADLVARARPVIGNAKHIAAVDIGWISACTESDIVDLAGLTDPEIAALHGGHTSKRVDASMLLDRKVDLVVLYSGHEISWRLTRDPLFASRYELETTLPLRDASYGVFVLRPRPD